MSKSRFNYLLYRWHTWAGLLGGAFLIVICVSGTVAVFRPEIERAVDWGGYDFNVIENGTPIGIEQAIATAEKKYPGGRAIAARKPDRGGSWHSHGPTYSIVIDQAKGPNLDVLVDPYRSEVVAAMAPNRGWGDWLRQLHVRLLYGSYWGRWLVGFFGLTLVFSTISGLVIFRKFNAGSWWPRVRWGRGTRIVTADLHKWVGLWTVAFNLVFGVSGAVIGLEGLYRKYVMSPPARPPTFAAIASLPPGRIESLMARATQLVPGTESTEATLPYRRNGLVKVEVEHPALKLVREHASYVLFNAASGEPVEVYDASKSPVAARFYYAMEPLHFGRLGGAMWVKLLWGLMGLSGGFLSVTGFVIYVVRWRNSVASAKSRARNAGRTNTPQTVGGRHASSQHDDRRGRWPRVFIRPRRESRVSEPAAAREPGVREAATVGDERHDHRGV